MQNKLSLWEILVPKSANDGTEYLVEYHNEWDKKVRDIAGGLTILKTAKGHWVDSDLFVEEMIPVRIYCSEENIDKIIEITLQHYNQEAVLAYEISSNVKLTKRN